MKSFLEVEVVDEAATVEGATKMLCIDVEPIVMIYQSDDGTALIEIYRDKTEQFECIMTIQPYGQVMQTLDRLTDVEVR